MGKPTVPSPRRDMNFTDWWREISRKLDIVGTPGALVNKSVRLSLEHLVRVVTIRYVELGYDPDGKFDFCYLHLSDNRKMTWYEKGRGNGWHLDGVKIATDCIKIY